MSVEVTEPMVQSFLTGVLKKVSKKTGIGLKTLRVQLRLNSTLDNVNIIALNNTEAVENIKWDSVVGAKYFIVKTSIVQGVFSRLNDLSEQNNIDKKEVNMRVYAIDANGTPRLHLYNGKSQFKPLEIKELL